jgi:pimeloyl-ACP methyl ester carboxylesterase
MTHRALLLLPLFATAALGVSVCPSGGPGLVAQEYLLAPGHVEPHTPGSGAVGSEMPASANVQSLVGADPDLNRVSTLRTYLDHPSAAPRTILILVPGFLGGAGTFTPLAEQLVAKFNGALEVWAVDRRPNQLEDRRGSVYAAAQIEGGGDARTAIEQAVAFYLPDDAPAPFTLPDALGAQRSYVRLEQDDMRFAAYWGVDTYLRDWKRLVDAARAIVGPDGLVFFGGHSQGTYWTSAFAAYDFDPDPGVVDAGYQHVDGLILLEGGGGGAPSEPPPDLATYGASVDALAQPGGPPVFLFSVFDIQPAILGPGAELSGLAGVHLPDETSILQPTSVFSTPPFSLFFTAPMSNRSLVGFFIDDDFQPVTAFRASVGFSVDGPNQQATLFGARFLIAKPNGSLRRWLDFDDPALPRCPPSDPGAPTTGPGCAIESNGPHPAPGEVAETWGFEREVSSLDDLLRVQVLEANFVEWYFLSGRTGLDAQYGIDSSALVAESVAADGSEGPLVLTQNANVDVPVLCIGGSNGLAPAESSFSRYLDSIATPLADRRVEILEGYAHLDPITASDDDAVPILADWINRLLAHKLVAGAP